MFSTQNSTDSLQDASANINNSSNGSILRSTPSPVGNGGRNSLSGNHNLRVVTPTSSSCTVQNVNPELVSKTGMPYHRSMINVSSDSPDIGVLHGVTIVSEKSQSHADLTKSNELVGYKNQKPILTRVSSTENAGVDTRHRNKVLHQYNVDNPQHGRSQSLLEIDSNNIVLRDGTTNKDHNKSCTGLFKNGNTIKDNVANKKLISDRSQSSSALLITPSIFDESPASKSNMIHTRRRHTLTKLKGK